jgi:hypothetical protein
LILISSQERIEFAYKPLEVQQSRFDRLRALHVDAGIFEQFEAPARYSQQRHKLIHQAIEVDTFLLAHDQCGSTPV